MAIVLAMVVGFFFYTILGFYVCSAFDVFSNEPGHAAIAFFFYPIWLAGLVLMYIPMTIRGLFGK